MRFYLVEVTQYVEPVNDKMEKFSMNGYDTEREAKAFFHQKLFNALRDDNVAKEVVSLMDDRGVMIINPEVYEKPVEPTPEPESEVEA